MYNLYSRILSLFIIVIIAIILSSCGASSGKISDESDEPLMFSNSINLSRSAGDSEGPLLAIEGSLINVSWLETIPASGGIEKHRELYTASSYTGGKSFSSPKSLSSGFETSQPSLTAYSNGTYASVFVGTILPSHAISEAAFFSDNTGGHKILSSVTSKNPDVVLDKDAGTLYFAWTEENADADHLYFARLKEGSDSFASMTEISDNGMVSEGPLLTVEGTNTANMVWTSSSGSSSSEVMYLQTTNGGNSFSEPAIISTGTGDVSCTQVHLADNKNFFVTWAVVNNDNTYFYVTATKDGEIFSSPGMVSRGTASCHQLAVGQNSQVYLVWEEGGNIFFTSSRNNTVFVNPVNLSGTLTDSASPKIAADGQIVFVVWEASYNNNKEVFLTSSINGGHTFSTPLNISKSVIDSTSPVIAYDDNGYLYVSWLEGKEGERDVFFKSYARSELVPDNATTGSPLKWQDINGDGFNDIIIGAPASDNITGKVYIYYGPSVASPVIVNGETENDKFGTSVSIAGDVNGDGYDDVLIGAPGADESLYSGNGLAYFYLGGKDGPSLFGTIAGTGTNAGLGEAVSGAGDINGDGCYDFMVGAPGASGGGGSLGEAYLFFGGGTGCLYSSLDLVPDLVFTGPYEDSNFGSTIGTAGDVNGDSYDDFVIAAPKYYNSKGIAYLYLGGNVISNIPDKILTGNNAGNLFGQSISAAGDINKDGFGDFIIGAPGSEGGEGRGEVFLYAGSSSVDITPFLSIQGENLNDNFGYSAAGIGDVDSDGYWDILVGAPQWDVQNPLEKEVGRAYLFSGKTLSQKEGMSLSSSVADVIWEGDNKYSYLGYSVSDAGDFNGDNIGDFLIGTPLWKDSDGISLGNVHLFYGWTTDVPDTSPDITIEGVTGTGLFGSVLDKPLSTNHR